MSGSMRGARPAHAPAPVPAPDHSPTSSVSSVTTTTPTSPYFSTHPSTRPARERDRERPSVHPYATAVPVAPSQLGSSVIYHPNGNGNGSSASLRSSSSSIIHPARPATPPLLRTPSDRSFASYLCSWGEGEVAEWLGVYKCGHYAAAFQRNDITGQVLLDLDVNALKEIGVSKVGERVKLQQGIKELRRRAAANAGVGTSRAPSRADSRLNGLSAPLWPENGLPILSPPVQARADEVLASSSNRRLDTHRPTPLDLQPHAHARRLPQAYQSPPSANSIYTTTTPRALPLLPEHQAHARENSLRNAGQAPRPGIPASTSSSVTVTRSNSLLRPMAVGEGRRTPSPINGLPLDLSRPLPLLPHQSSAAEYANSITQQRQASGGSSSSEGKITPPDQLNTLRTSQRGDPVHRKQLSGPAVPIAMAKQVSPIKAKFTTMINNSRNVQTQAQGSGVPHPFAASRSKEEERRPSPPQVLSSRDTSSASRRGPIPQSMTPSLSSSTIKLDTDPPTGSSGSIAISRSTSQLSLEDGKLKMIRFIDPRDGTSRVIDISECTNGVEILEKGLKKFGKWNTGSISSDLDSDDDGERLEIDGWGVYLESDPEEEAEPLSEVRLLAFCAKHRDPTTARGRGLYLHRIRRDQKQQKNRKNMEDFFGETPPPPKSPGSPGLAGSRVGGNIDPRLLMTPPRDAVKKTNRASTVSIMSGLGAVEAPPSPSTTRSPSSGSFLTKRKMYNFFGHRPPSELITNHIAEYFPGARRKELEKGVRHSMLRMSGAGLGKRSSLVPSDSRGSLDVPGRLDRRRSGLSAKTASPPQPQGQRRPPSMRLISSPPPGQTIPEESEASEDVPQVSIDSSDIEPVEASVRDSKPPLLPPFESTGESLSEQLQQYSPDPGNDRDSAVLPVNKNLLAQRRSSAASSRSRFSMLSQLRNNRDRSDTASMLTVDEITAEVEQRRTSVVSFDDSDTEDLATPLPTDPGFAQARAEEASDDDDNSYDEESEDDEDEEDEAAEDSDENPEQGMAFTSTGSKRIIKWIKGALIGAGSFGSVYLGMDSHSGLLMAVKQVELSGSGRQVDERKKTMVVALEREIELLKELQHENIVQYLGELPRRVK